MNRASLIVALLRGWMDYVPGPKTWTGELQRRAAARGPAPFRRVVCANCEGRGKTRGGWMCAGCKGQGVYSVDDYTGEPVDTVETPMRELLLRQSVNCSTCGGWGRLSAFSEQRPSSDYPLCEECKKGKVQAPFGGIVRADVEGREEEEERVGDFRLDGMADQHRRRDQQPAYIALDEAMREVHAADRAAHLALCLAYVLEWESPASLLAPMRLALARGLVFLDRRLPEKLNPPGEVFAAEVAREASLVRAKGNSADARARAKRDEEIRKRHRTGNYTLEQLGHYFSLDKSQVSRIVRHGADG